MNATDVRSVAVRSLTLVNRVQLDEKKHARVGLGSSGGGEISIGRSFVTLLPHHRAQ